MPLLPLLCMFGPTNAAVIVLSWMCGSCHKYLLIVSLFMQHVSAIKGQLQVCCVSKLLHCIDSILKETPFKIMIKLYWQKWLKCI
jgi:hypothetical protein